MSPCKGVCLCGCVRAHVHTHKHTTPFLLVSCHLTILPADTGSRAVGGGSNFAICSISGWGRNLCRARHVDNSSKTRTPRGMTLPPTYLFFCSWRPPQTAVEAALVDFFSLCPLWATDNLRYFISSCRNSWNSTQLMVSPHSPSPVLCFFVSGMSPPHLTSLLKHTLISPNLKLIYSLPSLWVPSFLVTSLRCHPRSPGLLHSSLLTICLLVASHSH